MRFFIRLNASSPARRMGILPAWRKGVLFDEGAGESPTSFCGRRSTLWTLHCRSSYHIHQCRPSQICNLRQLLLIGWWCAICFCSLRLLIHAPPLQCVSRWSHPQSGKFRCSLKSCAIFSHISWIGPGMYRGSRTFCSASLVCSFWLAHEVLWQ